MSQESSAADTTTRTRFVRARALFNDALAMSEKQQRPFLENACRGDASLFAEVLGMLEEDCRGTSVLEDGGFAKLADQILGATEVFSAQQLGPYRLIKPLGEGGMGVVYLAQRDDLGNAVAIKFLRDAWLSPARRERFASEQHLLASLNHPCIARLHDAGVLENGTPWFAMEYVDGVALTEYCRVRQCDLKERLRLFRSVCEAVQYAHEHAVIHRDLKPSNILVRADGSVRLLDFGIAKQLSDVDGTVDQTRTVLRLMTPAYAAPEQIRGEAVGVFTDIYALGVILFELLTGRTPGDLVTPGEGEPEKPSTANRSAVCVEANRTQWNDLDVLCLTARQKDAQRRYRSVEALIRDIDHYLNNEPLEARPDSFGYRTGKFLRRNRRPLLASALAVFVLLAMALFFTVRVTEARDEALNAAVRTQRVQRFILNLFEGSDNSTAPAKDLRVITLVDQGLREAQTLHNDPQMQADLYQTLGGIYQKLGNLPRADSLLSDALKERRSLSDRQHSDTAESLIALGLLRADEARYDDAERLIQEGLRIVKSQRPRNDQSLAKATAALGSVLTVRGSYSQAIPLLEEAAREESRFGQETPELIAILKQLADAQFDIGNYEACERINRQTLVLDKRLFGLQHPKVADDLINLGAVQFERGHYPEAEQFDRQALQIMQAWYGAEHYETASTLFMLSKALVMQKRFDEAVVLLQRAASIHERVYGSVDNPHLANVLNELALIACERSQWSEAEAQFGRAIKIYRTVYGERDDRVALGLSNVGGMYLDQKKYSQAEQILRDVLLRFHQTLPADHVNLGIAEMKLGRALLHQGKYQEASEQTFAGYQIITKHMDRLNKWSRGVREDLIQEYEALNRPDQAERYREEVAENK